MKDLKSLLMLAALLAATAAALPYGTAAQESRPQDGTGGAQGQGQVSLKLKGVDGKTYDIAEMRGEVVMVSFGATWCAPCVWELAAIEELKLEYKGKPVRFLWVSIEGEETPNTLLRHYAKSYRLTIPVLRDPLKEAFAQFSDRVRIPLVVFFDQNGRFVAPAHRGMSRDTTEYKQSMRARLDALLRSGSVDRATERATKPGGASAAN